MAYTRSNTLRIAQNIIDGVEYAGSIVSVRKQLRLDVPEDDKAFLVLDGLLMDYQFEVAVFPSDLEPLQAPFRTTCLLLINDQLLPLSPDLLADFVDRVLERSDLKTFQADALEECLADYKMSRTILIPNFQLMLGRKSQFILFIHGEAQLASSNTE